MAPFFAATDMHHCDRGCGQRYVDGRFRTRTAIHTSKLGAEPWSTSNGTHQKRLKDGSGAIARPIAPGYLR
jgi:hypothetical protein